MVLRITACSDLPLPKLPGLMPSGLDTLGLVPPVVLVLPVVPPPLSEALEEFGGPHGLGRGSRFSVRDGWAPDSEFPPRAENGLLPNYRKRDETHLKKEEVVKIYCSGPLKIGIKPIKKIPKNVKKQILTRIN